VLLPAVRFSAAASTARSMPSSWVYFSRKKAQRLPPLEEALIEPNPYDPEATTLELDEMWSFVAKKANKA
jgi:hypothetical protein